MDIRKLLKPRNSALIVLFLLSYILYFAVFFLTIRYSRLNFTLYFTVFAVMLLVILFFSILFYEGILERKKNLRFIGVGGLLIVSLLLGVLTFYLFRVNASINQVISDPNQAISVEFAFVTYDNTTVTQINDINNKKVGILSNAEDLDRNSFVKAELEKNSLNIEYIEYLSYNDLLLALFSEDVDVASLPSDYFNQFSGYEGYEDYLEKTKIVHKFTTKIESTNEIVDVDVSKDPFTILIMGRDEGRTDSLILATYNPLRLEVTMTSIPRDSYVPIACYPNQQKDKIGHAFAVSRDCAIETVENLMDVDINFYVVVNFQGVVDIVDALEKVWLESPVQFVGQNSSSERGHYTIWIPKGGFWATGEMALAFARERHQMPGGDLQRQENQQQVIRQLIERVLSLNDVNKAINVLDAAGKNIETNMSLDQMIGIFNGITQAVSRTSITPQFILDIIGSRLMGYSSYTYNESLQLPLWILKPYEGSIKDNKDLINSNLNESNLPSKIDFKFNAASYFYQPDYFALVYNEKEQHEQLPDFMPNVSYNDWTLEKLRTWTSTRGITLNVNAVKPGDPLYNASYVHNFVVGQSVRYGVKTSNFNTLTVQVIKHDLDCSIDANMQYDECKYKLPNFVQDQTKVVEIVKWASANSVTLTYTIIPESDPSFDKSKIGFAIKQSPESFADIRNLGELNLTVMDSNYSVVIPDTKTWTLDSAKAWVKENLFLETNIQIVNVATLDLTKINTIVSTKPATGAKMKIKDILQVTVYAEGIEFADLTGKNAEDIRTTTCTTMLCTFTKVETSDSTLVGKIASQSIPKGTIIIKNDLATTNVTFGVYTAPTSTTP